MSGLWPLVHETLGRPRWSSNLTVILLIHIVFWLFQVGQNDYTSGYKCLELWLTVVTHIVPLSQLLLFLCIHHPFFSLPSPSFLIHFVCSCIQYCCYHMPPLGSGTGQFISYIDCRPEVKSLSRV